MVTLPVAKLQKVFKLQSNSRVPLLKKPQQDCSGSRVSWWTFPCVLRRRGLPPLPWRRRTAQGRSSILLVTK